MNERQYLRVEIGDQEINGFAYRHVKNLKPEERTKRYQCKLMFFTKTGLWVKRLYYKNNKVVETIKHINRSRYLNTLKNFDGGELDEVCVGDCDEDERTDGMCECYGIGCGGFDDDDDNDCEDECDCWGDCDDDDDWEGGGNDNRDNNEDVDEEVIVDSEFLKTDAYYMYTQN